MSTEKGSVINQIQEINIGIFEAFDIAEFRIKRLDPPCGCPGDRNPVPQEPVNVISAGRSERSSSKRARID